VKTSSAQGGIQDSTLRRGGLTGGFKDYGDSYGCRGLPTGFGWRDGGVWVSRKGAEAQRTAKKHKDTHR
jgi:hypothetical protein